MSLPHRGISAEVLSVGILAPGPEEAGGCTTDLSTEETSIEACFLLAEGEDLHLTEGGLVLAAQVGSLTG